MPATFHEQERQRIRQALQERGQALFATYGLKKTSVEELTQAVGISKGAFYLFYDSKEELFFELLERYEARYRATLLEEIARHEHPPVERMRQMLLRALMAWKQGALFTRFSRQEYEQLLRKLPAEHVTAHLAGDEQYAETFVAAWRAQGVTIMAEPKIVSGLIRALFFVSLREEDFGEDVYAPVIGTLVDLLAQHLVGQSEAQP